MVATVNYFAPTSIQRGKGELALEAESDIKHGSLGELLFQHAV